MKPILILLLFISCNSFSQITFRSDSIRNYFHPEVENKIFNSSIEFQFRVWIKDDSLKSKNEDLLLLSYMNGKWFCEVFKYKRYKRSARLIRVHKKDESSDSLIYFLKEYRIFDLPDMADIRSGFGYPDENGNEVSVVYVGGPVYTFEFVTKDAFKKIEYQNPIFYNKIYGHIKELEKIVTIINFIHKTFPMLPIYYQFNL